MDSEKNDNRELPQAPDFARASSQESRFRLPLWAKAALILAAIALASVGYLKSSLWQNQEFSKGGLAELDPEELAKRQPVKDFSVSDAEGKPAKLSDYKGNVVILSFWASWCGPCLVELPTFAELEKKFHDKGLRILPVNIDEGDEGKQFAKDFWKKKGFPFPSFFDTTKVLSQQFEVEMLPSNFVIDRQGRQVFASFGANDWASAGTTEFIEGLLQESTTDPQPTEADANAATEAASPGDQTTRE